MCKGKTMKKKYKEVVHQNDKTGNAKTTWKYYDHFNSAYGNKAGTQAAVTYDSEGKQKKIQCYKRSYTFQRQQQGRL